MPLSWPDPIKRHPAVAVFLLALAVRVSFNLVFVMRSYQPVGDALDYVTIAENLVDGKGFAALFPDLSTRTTARRPPLFPLLLAACFALFGRGTVAPLLILSLIGAVTCVLLVHLARNLFGERQALVTGLLAAIAPGMWINNTTLMSETIYVLLLVALVLLAERATRVHTVAAVVSLGVVAGLMTLTRPEGILLSALLAFWIVAIRRGGDRWRAVLSVLAVAALLVAPWVTRNWVRFGAFIPSATSVGRLLACANNDRTYYEHEWLGGWQLDAIDPSVSPQYKKWVEDPAITEAEIELRLCRQGLRYVRAHVQRLPVVVVWRLRRALDVWNPIRSALHESAEGRLPVASIAAWLTFPPFLVVGALGAIRFRHSARRLFWLYAVVAFYVAEVMVTWGTPRLRSPMEPMIILFAAAYVSRGDVQVDRPRAGMG
jgi:4-amino-4-deoxy-L-arabinose transferase-like glycosyltransferase